MPLQDLLALVTLAAVWGGSFLFIRVAAPVLGPFPLVMGRVAIAAVALWAGARVLGQRPALRAHWRKLLVLGVINAAVPFALISAAELRLTASLAAMLNATVPLWAALFGVLWLGERVTARRGVGLALGLVGVGVLVGWSPIAATRETVLSVGAMLVATAGYALAGVFTKRALTGVDATTLALGQQLGACALLVVPTLWTAPSARATPAALLSVLALGLLSTAVAYVLYFRLIARIGPMRTTTVTYLIPIFGTLWGVLFLGESVTGGMLVGLAAILASVVFVNDVRLRWPFGRRAIAGREASA